MDCNFWDTPLICLETQGNRANPEYDSPQEITHKTKSSQPDALFSKVKK